VELRYAAASCTPNYGSRACQDGVCSDGLLKQLTKTVLTEASGHVGIEPRGDDLEDPPEASSAVVKRPGS
jgi:hypothetical protein